MRTVRPIAAFASAGLAALLLAGCSSTDTPEGYTRVETWTWSSDGTEEHSVNYRKDPEKGPEWQLGGIFRIQDYTKTAIGDRNCYVELTPAKAGQNTFLSRYVQDKCTADMKHVAGWRPTGGTVGDVIILVDAKGKKIGEFDKVSDGGSLYRGIFTLTDGAVVQAHLKRW